MAGARLLQDVIDGVYDDPFSAENPEIVAGRTDLKTHRTAWQQEWGQLAGQVMPQALIDNLEAQ